LWGLIGGTQYLAEPAGYAARRHAQEEAGIEIIIFKSLGIMEIDETDPVAHGFGYAKSEVVICKPAGGVLKAGEGSVKLKYFRKIPDNTILAHKEYLEEPQIRKYFDCNTVSYIFTSFLLHLHRRHLPKNLR